MHTAKCEDCGKERRFATYSRDWPTGWVQTGKSKYGKRYQKKSGWAWWCPECQEAKKQAIAKWPTVLLRALGRIK